MTTATSQAPEGVLLSARGLSKSFVSGSGWGAGRQRVRALTDVDLDLPRGSTLAVVGESGSGKTTLARVLMRLTQPDAGSVDFDGRDLLALGGAELRRQRRRFQMVFQDPFGSLNPRMRVGAAIAEPLRIHNLTASDGIEGRVVELLDLVGLDRDAARRYPHQFSGGQRQRVGIARALATEPDLLIADEPVSALDVSVQAQILNLLMELRQQLGLTVLFITHDMAVVRQIADRIAVLYLGRVVEHGAADDVLGMPQHPYTRALLESVPQPDPGQRRRFVAGVGEPPDPAHPPSGCAFHPRCPRADEQCSKELPLLNPVDADGDRSVACFHPGLDPSAEQER